MTTTGHSTRLARITAIVTGSGSVHDGQSVGYAIARTLARQGASTVIVDRSLDAAHTSAQRMISEGVSPDALLVAEADVALDTDCARVVELARHHFGQVTTLINNVGITGPAGTAVEVDVDHWNAALATNLTSMMLMAKHAIPAMPSDGTASIVNISSVAGLRGGHPSLLYPTSKGAVATMTQAMAVHHGRSGIRVNCVAPGLIYTPMVARRGMTDEQRSARADRTLLGTEGTATDVADAVAFLVSQEARWITGVVLPVDGGETSGDAHLPVPPSDGK